MTRAFVAALAGVAALVAAGSAGAKDAADLPPRQDGHWEGKTVMDEGFGPREQKFTMCVDADMERKTALASKQEHAKKCTRYEIKKDADATVVDAQCNFDGRKFESTTEMSGDFEHVFKISIDSTTSGSERGQSISVKRTITQEGKYLGADCGTLQAGEAMGTDGHKVLVQ